MDDDDDIIIDAVVKREPEVVVLSSDDSDVDAPCSSVTANGRHRAWRPAFVRDLSPKKVSGF